MMDYDYKIVPSVFSHSDEATFHQLEDRIHFSVLLHPLHHYRHLLTNKKRVGMSHHSILSDKGPIRPLLLLFL